MNLPKEIFTRAGNRKDFGIMTAQTRNKGRGIPSIKI